MMLSGWGNYPRVDCAVLRPRDTEQVMDTLGARSTLDVRKV